MSSTSIAKFEAEGSVLKGTGPLFDIEVMLDVLLQTRESTE